MKCREPRKAELVEEMKDLRIKMSNLERENLNLREEVNTWQTVAVGVICAAVIAIVLMAVRSAS